MEENRAINVNSLSGNPFPVTLWFSAKDNVYRVYLTPISVLEIVDLLPEETFLIFGVGTYEFVGDKTLALSDVVAKHSSFLNKFDEETLQMKKKDVVKLLNEVSHYNFSLIDVKENVGLDKVIQIIDVADKWNEKIIINEVSANVFLSSHDDCYLYFETNEKDVILELISLQIKILVSTFLNQSTDKLNFEPNDLIINDEFSIVIPQNPIETDKKIFWKIFQGTFKNFVYGEEMPESEFNLIYFKLNNEIKIEKVRS